MSLFSQKPSLVQHRPGLIAVREYERQEAARLRRLGDVRPAVQCRPPRPLNCVSSAPASSNPTKFPSAPASCTETPGSSRGIPSGCAGSLHAVLAPPVHVWKPRARSHSPQTRLEPVQNNGRSEPTGPSMRKPKAAPLPPREPTKDSVSGSPQNGGQLARPQVGPKRRSVSHDSLRAAGVPPTLAHARRGGPRRQAEAQQNGQKSRSPSPGRRAPSPGMFRGRAVPPALAAGNSAPVSPSQCTEAASAPTSTAQASSAAVPAETLVAETSTPAPAAAAAGAGDLKSAQAIEDWLAQANARLANAFAPPGAACVAVDVGGAVSADASAAKSGGDGQGSGLDIGSSSPASPAGAAEMDIAEAAKAATEAEERSAAATTAASTLRLPLVSDDQAECPPQSPSASARNTPLEEPTQPPQQSTPLARNGTLVEADSQVSPQKKGRPPGCVASRHQLEDSPVNSSSVAVNAVLQEVATAHCVATRKSLSGATTTTAEGGADSVLQASSGCTETNGQDGLRSTMHSSRSRGKSQSRSPSSSRSGGRRNSRSPASSRSRARSMSRSASRSRSISRSRSRSRSNSRSRSGGRASSAGTDDAAEANAMNTTVKSAVDTGNSDLGATGKSAAGLGATGRRRKSLNATGRSRQELGATCMSYEDDFDEFDDEGFEDEDGDDEDEDASDDED